MTSKGAAALNAALEELRQRRAEIQELRAERNEPVAVIGMGCRFPGNSDTPHAFWNLLQSGHDAVTEVPRARWDIERYYDPDPAKPGKMATRFGAFLSDVDLFDASFFNISPREATFLDPQQRILLEVAWEAIENANIAADQLRQSPTGVYAGITCFDHAVRIAAADQSSSYAGTGSALNMAAGRLSFFLGLTGPSMAIDTACSSSLVCLHLACESLRSREIRAALVGGINLMLSPDVMVSFSQARMLSPDGRCKTFDAAADGYVRGEGCGMVLLKRLSDAVADGNRILGVIRGTAVDHGGASGGLTVPSSASQQRVMRRAIEQAGVSPEEVDYVEAHGTGTSLGDPIEMEALAEVYGAERDASRPLLVGSVKTNIGHSESAAGVAGLMKILLSFEHGEIPAHLHFVRPNPHIAWNEIAIRIAAQAVAWPRERKKRIAGLSAFGFSGTNAHAVIEEPPLAAAPAEARRKLLTVSAKSQAALNMLAESYESLIRSAPAAEWPAICRAAAGGRNHFAFRMARTLSSPATYRGQSQIRQPLRVILTFPGQGTRFARELYDSEVTFRNAFERCQGSLTNLDADVSRFAIDYAWAELWNSWDVRPYALIGVGVGEIAAACQSGVMSLEDGLRLVAAMHNPPEFARSARSLRFRPPRTRLASNEVTDPDYWIRQLTSAMPCADKMSSFSGCTLLPSPRAGDALERSVAWLYVRGMDLDWAAFFSGRRQPSAALPNYPFEKQRFWLDIEEPKDAKPAPEQPYYAVRWEEQSVPSISDPSNLSHSTWLVLADDEGLGFQLAALLRNKGAHRVHTELDSKNPEQLRRVLSGTNDPNRRIVFLWGLNETGVSSRGCIALLHLFQLLHGSPSRIWVVTRAATEAGKSPQTSGSAQSALLGFAKSAGIEHPELFGGIIDLDLTATDHDADLLLNEILVESAEDQVAFREGLRYVPRLTKSAGETAPLPVSSSGAYLITGGCGFLGLRTARWLAARGARSIILAGRNGASSQDARTAIEELRSKGADIRCERLDIADPVAVESLFRTIQQERIPLRGIIHAAGVPGYKPLLKLDGSELEAVLRPKMNGAWLLHEHSRDLPIDFFLLYSSIASAWGSRDQAHYSAANRYLDALAHHRRQLGLPAQSINWGPWAQGGMTSSDAEVLLRRIGVNMLNPDAALDTLNHLPSIPQFAVANIDWPLFQDSYEARGRRPFLDRLRIAPQTVCSKANLPKPIRTASHQERKRALAESIEREAAQVLGFASARLDRDIGFFEMGMDSLLALELRTRLETALGMPLQATALFDHPSINALAEFCAGTADPGTDPAVASLNEALRNRVESLSEEEAEAMLLARLEALT